jgi:hypothetical protein
MVVGVTRYRSTLPARIASLRPNQVPSGAVKRAPVLRLVDAGDKSELRCVADLDGASFDHDIETIESVLARGENALRVLL